jgi:hypothetical protein
MEIKRVGVDLAKNVFQVHGVNGHEKPVWKRSLRRGRRGSRPVRRCRSVGREGLHAARGAVTKTPDGDS